MNKQLDDLTTLQLTLQEVQQLAPKTVLHFLVLLLLIAVLQQTAGYWQTTDCLRHLLQSRSEQQLSAVVWALVVVSESVQVGTEDVRPRPVCRGPSYRSHFLCHARRKAAGNTCWPRQIVRGGRQDIETELAPTC